MPTKLRPRLACLALLVVVLVTYGGSLGNAAVLDDHGLVIDNPYLGSLHGLARIWTTDISTASVLGEPTSYYRPLPMFAFWLNVALGGRSPTLFHLGNVLIHALNAVLLALFVRKAAGLRWRSASIVAVLFAVAPICSEPVLWISGRFDLLIVTFALTALLAARMKDRRIGLAALLASVAAGLLCKESFAAWLPLLVLDDMLVRRTRRTPAAARLEKYVGIALVATAYFALRRVLGIHPLGDAIMGTGALARSFLFLAGSFLRELVWPTSLDAFRPLVIPSTAALFAIVAVLGALVAVPLATRRFQRRSVTARFAVFGVAWFVLVAIPSAMAAPTLAMVGDRYAYLPLVGVFLMAAAILGELEARPSRGWLAAATGAGALTAVVCSIATARHARDWRDDTALAESSLASDPENPYPLYLLGTDAAEHGELAKADDLLARSMARNPSSWRTWNAVCYLRMHQNRLAEAERACKKTIDLNGSNPRAWLNLASVYVRAQRWNEALVNAERALERKPGFAEAHYLAGVSAANLGRFPLAASHVEAGLRADPSHPRLLVLKSELERYERVSRPAPGP